MDILSIQGFSFNFRLLIDIATGVNTCGDRGEVHEDGETVEHILNNNTSICYRRVHDDLNPPHADDEDQQVQVRFYLLDTFS